jgi:hypothetical protein
MRIVLLLFLAASGIPAQTLGQLRLVDFSARTPVTISALSGTGPISITTSAPHNLSTGAAVYIYRSNCTVAQDYTTCSLNSAGNGNHGRGYFIVSGVDATHLNVVSEMYAGKTAGIANGMAVGDTLIPLTTYYLRDGPKVLLDGPINKGAWSYATNYRTHDLVTDASGSYMAIADNLNQRPPNRRTGNR